MNLIQKFLHWWIEADYIYWRNSADKGIARVRCNEDGVAWYFLYKVTKTINHITWTDVDTRRVIFLTGSAEDYLGERNGTNY